MGQENLELLDNSEYQKNSELQLTDSVLFLSGGLGIAMFLSLMPNLRQVDPFFVSFAVILMGIGVTIYNNRGIIMNKIRKAQHEDNLDDIAFKLSTQAVDGKTNEAYEEIIQNKTIEN